MLTNLILYKYSDYNRNKWQIDENTLKNSNLEKCLVMGSGQNVPFIKGLIDNTKNEKISLNFKGTEYSRFSVNCEFKTNVPLGAGGAVFLTRAYEIVLLNNLSLLFTVNAGKSLSKVGTTLLSYSTTNDPSAIESLALDKNKFTSLKDWIFSGPLPGQIKKITFNNVSDESVFYKQVVLSAENLQNAKLFTKLWSSASAISNLSFQTPLLRTSNRSLTCRLSYWGALTIYTGGVLESEIFELLRKISNILI